MVKDEASEAIQIREISPEEMALVDAQIEKLSPEPGGVEGSKIRTLGHGVLRGPDGEVKEEFWTHNLITQNGDQVYGERASGAAAPNAPTGMRLGTGSTAVAKTGAGSFIGTYISGSQKAFESGFPSSALQGAARRIAYKCIWAAGVATATGIVELVLTNETPLTNVQGAAANTISRILLTSFDKGALDTFEYTLYHDFQG